VKISVPGLLSAEAASRPRGPSSALQISQLIIELHNTLRASELIMVRWCVQCAALENMLMRVACERASVDLSMDVCALAANFVPCLPHTSQ
jgi:hypothetical protein